jgi:hypothetical protein
VDSKAYHILQTGFYMILAAIPITIGVYGASRPDKDGKMAGLSRFIDSFSYYKEKWTERNTLHVNAIEQAAFNKNLDLNSTPSKHIELKFPEYVSHCKVSSYADWGRIFNTGSPMNIVAGQGPRNMDALVAHYQKANVEEEERKARVAAAKRN